MKKEKSYHETVNISNQIKLREQLSVLPSFCKEYFIGIEQSTSSLTRLSYAYDLSIFFDFIHNSNPVYKNTNIREFQITILEKITPMDIEEYLTYLKYYKRNGREYTNDERGIMRKLASLRSFYNYYFRKELIYKNPPTLVNMPKIHDKNIIRLDIDEVALLLDNIESGENLTSRQKKFNSKTKVRDLAILTLMLGTGIRVSECIGLDIDDIDFKNNGIKIHRKGGEEVVIYFGEEVNSALVSYLEERKKIHAVDGSLNALFLSLQKKRISVRAVEKLVTKYSKTVTTLKTITPHKLRSTYGTTLYHETGDIYLVADVLGHKDVNTTKKHYAAQDDQRRRKAASTVRLRESK